MWVTADDRRPLQDAIGAAAEAGMPLCIPAGTYILQFQHWFPPIAIPFGKREEGHWNVPLWLRSGARIYGAGRTVPS